MSVRNLILNAMNNQTTTQPTPLPRKWEAESTRDGFFVVSYYEPLEGEYLTDGRTYPSLASAECKAIDLNLSGEF